MQAIAEEFAVDRAIGVTSLKRSQVLPETPTIAEQGYLKIDAKSWYALMAPAGVPKEIINKLSQECARILRLPDLKERLAALGTDVVGGDRAQCPYTLIVTAP